MKVAFARAAGNVCLLAGVAGTLGLVPSLLWRVETREIDAPRGLEQNVLARRKSSHIGSAIT